MYDRHGEEGVAKMGGGGGGGHDPFSSFFGDFFGGGGGHGGEEGTPKVIYQYLKLFPFEFSFKYTRKFNY